MKYDLRGIDFGRICHYIHKSDFKFSKNEFARKIISEKNDKIKASMKIQGTVKFIHYPLKEKCLIKTLTQFTFSPQSYHDYFSEN